MTLHLHHHCRRMSLEKIRMERQFQGYRTLRNVPFYIYTMTSYTDHANISDPVSSVPLPLDLPDDPLTKDTLPLPTPPIPSSTKFLRSHPIWWIQWLLLIVAYLHSRCHVPHRACGILLWCL